MFCQDSAKAGIGTISVTANTLDVTGVGTNFTVILKPGDSIRIKGTSIEGVVASVCHPAPPYYHIFFKKIACFL